MEWTPENIKLLRILLGDTPQAFADRFRVPAATVAAWETRNTADPRFRKPGERACALLESCAAEAGFNEEKRRAMKGE
jgi:DNA-binding transcriptional regulator YiaG